MEKIFTKIQEINNKITTIESHLEKKDRWIIRDLVLPLGITFITTSATIYIAFNSSNQIKEQSKYTSEFHDKQLEISKNYNNILEKNNNIQENFSKLSNAVSKQTNQITKEFAEKSIQVTRHTNTITELIAKNNLNLKKEFNALQKVLAREQSKIKRMETVLSIIELTKHDLKEGDVESILGSLSLIKSVKEEFPSTETLFLSYLVSARKIITPENSGGCKIFPS